VVGQELNTKFSSRTILFERFAFIRISAAAATTVRRSTSQLRQNSRIWLGWQITYSDRYITNPPNGLKGNDQLLSTGLRLSFGKQ
jgi:hypothetical protein